MSTGTKDYDGDSLKYEWKVVGGGTTKIYKHKDPIITLIKAGNYKATLTVTDHNGAKNSDHVELKAGNEPPAVSIDVANANKTFYFPGTPIKYAVKVNDKEDGSLANGKIQASQIAVSLDYMPLGYDQIDIAATQRDADMAAFASTGQLLMNKSDCKNCHLPNKRSGGPSYLEIAKRYKGKEGAVESLAQKVIKGGSGVWGEHAMSAHPQLSVADSRAIVEYIMTTGEKKPVVKSAPIKGNWEIKPATEQKEKGTYVMRAAYRDKGTASMKPLVGEEIIVLRYPNLNPELADMTKGFTKYITPMKSLNMDANQSYLAYKDIDLTGLAGFEVKVMGNPRNPTAGASVEIRLDRPDGPLAGKSDFISTTARGPIKTKINLTETTGKHTIYFVFVNDKAALGQTLVQIADIEVLPKATIPISTATK